MAQRSKWLREHDPAAADRLDEQSVAAYRRECLPGGRTARCHWRKWVAAVAKADGVSEADVMAYFDGEAVLDAKTPQGDAARKDLCEVAWKHFPHVIV